MLKNITFSAEEELIKRARKKASREHTTLNAVFRQWINQYINRNTKTIDFNNFMEQLSYADSGRHFSREELNER
jgi:predicted transcriptional regulator